jgi:2Fe-2S ferredoxin
MGYSLLARITYIQPDGTQCKVEVRSGLTVMQGALKHDIAGIEARCGGACSCGTCHVYVEERSLQLLPDPSAAERSLLAGVFGATNSSRLSCQIRVRAELDGLIVRIPEFQG